MTVRTRKLFIAKVTFEEKLKLNAAYWIWKTDKQRFTVGKIPPKSKNRLWKMTMDEWYALGLNDDYAKFELVEVVIHQAIPHRKEVTNENV